MIVFVDPGHGDKGDHHDPGAVVGHLVEAAIVRQFAPMLAAALEGAGIKTELLGVGPYPERWAEVEHQAERSALDIAYLAIHCDVGGADRFDAFYHHRSAASAKLAQSIAAQMALPEYDAMKSQASRRGDWTRRADYCIRWTYPLRRGVVGVLLELGFLDSARHAMLWTPDGYARMARSIAAGVVDWEHSRSRQ